MRGILLSGIICALIHLAATSGTAQKHATSNEVTATASTHVMPWDRFLLAVPKTERTDTPRAFLMPGEYALFKEALKKHRAKLVVRAGENGVLGAPVVLGASRKQSHVGDVDVDIDGRGRITTEAVKSVVRDHLQGHEPRPE